MIRYLTEGDLEVFRAIRIAALSSDPEAFGETLEMFYRRSERELAEKFADLVSGRKKIIAVIEAGEPVAMCGFVIADGGESTASLWGMFVSPLHRKKGLGGELLSEAERWITENGGDTIRAKVAAPNQAALRFYTQCGYTILPQSGTLREGSQVPVHPIEKVLSKVGI